MVNYQGQLDSIGRQRDFTQSMLGQALAPQQNQTALTGVARLLAAYLANKKMGSLDEQHKNVMGQQSEGRKNELSRILSMTKDQPAHMLPPDQVGPSAPARPGVPLAQALMGSELPEFQDMGLQASIKGMLQPGQDTPSNVAEWKYYNSLSPVDQKAYLNMKRSGFGAGGVQYTAGGEQIVPTGKIAGDKAYIAGEVEGAKEKAQTDAAKEAKGSVLDSMNYVMSQYADIFPKITTGGPMGVAGQASRVLDSQDIMRFENLNQQLSTELRTVFRIPGEGTLSDKEQAQYGLQLPNVKYDQATNEAILKDLQARAGLRAGQQPSAGGGIKFLGFE